MEEKYAEAFENWLQKQIVNQHSVVVGKTSLSIDSITEYKYQIGRLRALEKVHYSFQSFWKNGHSGEEV